MNAAPKNPHTAKDAPRPKAGTRIADPVQADGTLFPPLPQNVRDDLRRLCTLIDKTFPLPSRFRAKLPANVAELSRLLTSARSERDAGYLGRAENLSAYLRYFLPWNVFRLCRLFQGLASPHSPTANNEAAQAAAFPALKDGDAVTDLGSGPLTLPVALWIAFPHLRALKLNLRCIDQSGSALDAGKKIFSALSENSAAWSVKTIRGPIETPVYGGKAALVSAVTVFNENAHAGRAGNGGGETGAYANRAAALLDSLCADSGTIFVAEPGVPQSAAFIAELRAALIERKRLIAAPCPHNGTCPLPGGYTANGKAKWCHFAFGTDDAPETVRELSAAAGIPKERAVLSFLLTAAGGESANTPPIGTMNARVISDMFAVPGGFGRYACSGAGLVLLRGGREQIESCESGTLVDTQVPVNAGAAPGKASAQALTNLPRDKKSGAIIVEVK